MPSIFSRLQYFLHLKNREEFRKEEAEEKRKKEKKPKNPAETYPPYQNADKLMRPAGGRLRAASAQQMYTESGTGGVPQTADDVRRKLRDQRMAGIGRVIDTQVRPVDSSSDFQGNKALLTLRPVKRTAGAVNDIVRNVVLAPQQKDPRLLESIRDAQEVAEYEASVAQLVARSG
jgi:hypothetical protein